jgi:hypothetical protein
MAYNVLAKKRGCFAEKYRKRSKVANTSPLKEKCMLMNLKLDPLKKGRKSEGSLKRK